MAARIAPFLVAAIVAAAGVAVAGGPAAQAAGTAQDDTIMLASTARLAAEPVDMAGADFTLLDLTFEFYGGGIHAASLNTRAAVAPARYEIASRIQTEGVVDTLFHGIMQSSARGRLTDDGPRLESYAQYYNGRFGERAVQMSREPSGMYQVAAVPRDGLLANGQLPSSVKGAVDPLTASIYGALNEVGEPCAQSIPMFDGRRVFRLDFSYDATEELNPQSPGVFAGEAFKCKVKYRPVAGQSRKWKIEEAKNPTPPVTVWLARFGGVVGDDGGTRQFVLPVRMLFETRYINAVVHLTRAEIDGRELVKTAALSN